MTDTAVFGELKGKVIVITGAGGIMCGHFSEMLAAAGAKVAMIDIDENAVIQKKDRLRSLGYTANAYQADVLCREALQKVKADIHSDFGAVDILINGAGGNHPSGNTETEYLLPEDFSLGIKTFYDIDPDGFEQVFRLNFMGTFFPCQVFTTDMISRSGCSVINIASMNAIKPLTKLPAYSAAKAAVVNFTQWLSVYYSKAGIRVNAIAPGFFITNQNRPNLLTPEGEYTPRAHKILASTPVGRFGKIEELDGVLLFLLCESLSSFVNGAIIPVDGGFSAYCGV